MTAAAVGGRTHLNVDGAWRGFHRRGLDVVDGRLRLAALPAGPTAPAPPAAPPTGPAGLAVAPDRTVFFTDGATVVAIDGCDGAQHPVPCLGGEGDGWTRFHGPSGLLVHSGRGALLVADTGNDRVQLFDLRSHQLLDVWDGLDRPVALAADAAGGVYVLDHGGIRRFTAGGEPDRRFAATGVSGVAVAVLDRPDGPLVCVLDRAGPSIDVLDGTGARLGVLEPDLTAPLGLAVTADAIYVGERDGVVRLGWDGDRVGVATGRSGPVAALALDGRGGLWVHPGSGAPLRLVLGAGAVRRGIAWGGPFGGIDGKAGVVAKEWQRLVATVAALPVDAHVRFFVHTTGSPLAGPPVDEDGPVPFPAPAWSAGPPDLDQFLVRRPAARYAWVGMHLSGEGATSAEVAQVRLDFDQPGYLEHLPTIYEAPADGFLPRYLALAGSLFGEVEAATAGLTGLLDPAAAPPEFLAELARWLAVDAGGTGAGWDTADLRDAVAAAYTETAARGTVAGLRAAVCRATGVDVVIEEPIAQTSWWALAAGGDDPAAERETSLLGITTMLAGAEPQGAVLGSTATLGRAQLITDTEYGMQLFDTVAHRFTVRVHRGACFSPRLLARLRDVLDREKPAHTEYALCVVEPGLAVGLARVGVDTVVAGGPSPGGGKPGGFVLGGEPPGRVGQGGIGVTTRLGTAGPISGATEES